MAAQRLHISLISVLPSQIDPQTRIYYDTGTDWSPSKAHSDVNDTMAGTFPDSSSSTSLCVQCKRTPRLNASNLPKSLPSTTQPAWKYAAAPSSTQPKSKYEALMDIIRKPIRYQKLAERKRNSLLP